MQNWPSQAQLRTDGFCFECYSNRAGATESCTTQHAYCRMPWIWAYFAIRSLDESSFYGVCEQCDSTCDRCDGSGSANCLTCASGRHFKSHFAKLISIVPSHGSVEEDGYCYECLDQSHCADDQVCNTNLPGFIPDLSWADIQGGYRCEAPCSASEIDLGLSWPTDFGTDMCEGADKVGVSFALQLERLSARLCAPDGSTAWTYDWTEQVRGSRIEAYAMSRGNVVVYELCSQ